MDNAQQACYGFEVSAHKLFDSLCTGSGFRCVESRPDFVRYESSSVYFEVGFSVNYDREVYSRIGRIGFPGVLPDQSAERLDFGLLLAIADPAASDEVHRTVPYAIATSEQQVRWVLSYFASGLRVHGQALLTGEAEAYERAREARFWHAPDFPPEALIAPTTRPAVSSRAMTEAEWLACPHLYAMIRFLEAREGNDRRLRLFACACCRCVLDLLREEVARTIVELSEAYADGEASDAELETMEDHPDLRNFTDDTSPPISRRVLDAHVAAQWLSETPVHAISISQRTSGEPSSDFIASPDNGFGLGRAVPHGEAAVAEQMQLLRDIFGNPFRPVAFSPEWRTDTTVSLARQMYESRDFSAMPILADALQDAGCGCADILDHCRGPGPHCRGCWVVDLVLGKE
jgi:hypothetical protein